MKVGHTGADLPLPALESVLFFADTCTETIVPLVCKFCQQALVSEDPTLPAVARNIGKLCHGLGGACQYSLILFAHRRNMWYRVAILCCELATLKVWSSGVMNTNITVGCVSGRGGGSWLSKMLSGMMSVEFLRGH